MNMYIQAEDGEHEITNSTMIEHLEEQGYSIIGDGVNTLDYEGDLMLKEIIEKFLVSDIFARKKIFNKVTKETTILEDYNNVDLFNYLDEQSFDFLDYIDTQEIISHLETVGYIAVEQYKM